jgi:hypothetical protein
LTSRHGHSNTKLRQENVASAELTKNIQLHPASLPVTGIGMFFRQAIDENSSQWKKLFLVVIST